MKFQVFKNGNVVDKFDFYGAYLFGSDGIAIRRARIKFKDGCVECSKPTLQTAGLTLLWPVEGFGRVLLPTTCLPEREKPYILNVEITRAKLMQIVNKREDWSLFNNSRENEKLIKEAQTLFIEALQNISDAPKAAKLADESLKRAIVLSEQLAGHQAGVLFEARRKSHGFGRGCLGCLVNPEQIGNVKYIQGLLALSGFVTVPINWAKIEKEEGKYDFSTIDACVQVLKKKRLAIGAGPLLQFKKNTIPKWLVDSKAGFEKVRETAYRFVSKVVSRYSGSVRAWRVVSGLNAFNYFGFGFDQVLEMTKAASLAVKVLGDRALKIIEIANHWGEYYADTQNTISPLVYVDMIVQSGINFDALGLQFRVGKNQAGMHVRDMMQISAILDYFAPLSKPVYITEVEVPSEIQQKSQSGKAAGIWHDEWNQMKQAEWIGQFYKIALSKSFVDTVTYSHLIDAEDSLIAGSGLLTDKFEPKKSYLMLKKLRGQIFGG